MDLPPPAKPDVVLRVPADSAYVSVLRTMTAGLAARLDFTVDDIEDLRIAVGEACALVLPEAAPGGDLEAEFRLDHGALTVSVSVPTEGPSAPDQDSFAWQVLSTLATSTSATAGDDRYEVTFVTESSVPPDRARSGVLG
ncbi:ATP-binding protein [Nocardioides cynanchi]|uniref:ATP-binding protein n=1 Tax=Nocardioides cynanchi TaxID=2558918 RepID=UPI0012459E96|nr:ATP-binding protein [Nocardioides cynanchi]